MRTFRNRAEAEKAGWVVSNNGAQASKWRGDGEFDRAIVRSDLEAQLAEALEAIETLMNEDGSWECPQCGYMHGPANEEAKREHAPNCKLSLALKKFRGEA